MALTKPKDLPSLPGVYLFMDGQGTVLYVGKAKNLQKRISNYFRPDHEDFKVTSLLEAASRIDHIITKSEVEALLLEAKLIKNYQPKFNVLLKMGDPYLYIVFTKTDLPELKLVREKKSGEIAFGPFLEKRHARQVYKFLINTFRLRICNKKIPSGCLYYHLGTCAGTCRTDFDKQAYLNRLSLAQKALSSGHKKFLEYLDEQIKENNKLLNFEKSQELHTYHQAFENIFSSLDTSFTKSETFLNHKHIWILINNELFLFDEHNGITKKKASFILDESHSAYFESYYRDHDCPHSILTNFDLEDKTDYETFLKQWHKKNYPVKITTHPENTHLMSLVNLATIHAEEETKKRKTLNLSLKALLLLPKEPETIDCFDISHKQGVAMVGSCVRFKNGIPDKNNFRKFKIKTITQQDDYASLREIVARRYKNREEFPDLILIDGGKGQLNAVKNLFPEQEFASLAKSEETIFSNRLPDGKKLDIQNPADRSLIALRDYAHHFAISYHKKLASKTLS